MTKWTKTIEEERAVTKTEMQKRVCELLVHVYEQSTGQMQWEDIDEIHELAVYALEKEEGNEQ